MVGRPKQVVKSFLSMFTRNTVAQCSSKPARAEINPFKPYKPAPGVLPANASGLAMDSNIASAAAWAGGAYNWAFAQGQEFLGYPYLAELAQRPEYRRIVEVVATEMTRKWIRLDASGDDDSKTDKIEQIMAEMARLNVRDEFKNSAEGDGFFGRGHLYLDTGDTEDPNELMQDIGDGLNKISKQKVGIGDLKALRYIEPVWTYPTNYNSNNPLRDDWYKPEVWFVMGTRIHASRLLTFIGREVPDLLKPAYSFGGLSLTQMAKPDVDNWLQTRDSVSDIISAFSTYVLKTDMMAELQAGGAENMNCRAEVFNQLRNNRGLMMIDKNQEDFLNVSAPLGSLDKLQAQAQEHMASVSGIPLVKLLGVTPSGLNASSDGEIRCFYDWIGAYQEALFRINLTKVVNFIQLSLFGEVDEDIIIQFEPLWELDEKELAEVDKLRAETAQIRIDSGVIAPEEDRQRIASELDTPYPGLDVSDVPDLRLEEEEGLEPKGGRPDPALTDPNAKGKPAADSRFLAELV